LRLPDVEDGWLTRVIGVIGRKCHWTTYFKLIERGSIKIQALANQLLRLLLRFAPAGPPMVVLDDTLLIRWSASAGVVQSRVTLWTARQGL